MKHTRKDHLWYNQALKKTRAIMSEGGGISGMDIERLAESQEGRSLLESYCRFYSTIR